MNGRTTECFTLFSSSPHNQACAMKSNFEELSRCSKTPKCLPMELQISPFDLGIEFYGTLMSHYNITTIRYKFRVRNYLTKKANYIDSKPTFSKIIQ